MKDVKNHIIFTHTHPQAHTYIYVVWFAVSKKQNGASKVFQNCSCEYCTSYWPNIEIIRP